MRSYCLSVFLISCPYSCISGANIPQGPGGAPGKQLGCYFISLNDLVISVFKDECKDPSLNDCPATTSICIDEFYGYSCQCKPGFVDRSPDRENPGRLCVPANEAQAAAPPQVPEEPPPAPVSTQPVPSEPQTKVRQKMARIAQYCA